MSQVSSAQTDLQVAPTPAGTARTARARRLGYATKVSIATFFVLIALWWLAAGQWLLDAVTRTGGIFVDPPHVLG